ncbi:MAG: hypothetical protein V3V28_08605 [Polaribacter sp.]|uniref:hypothetical protein n=1 Tax=Polaribacter sp. TaxID=1920175 RepID=UPI002F3607E3
MQVTILNNQTLLDIAIQRTGKAENLLKIAVANNLVPTELIAPGTTIVIPDTVDIDEDIIRYYTANNVLPATALTEEQKTELELTFWKKVFRAFKK